MEKTKKNHSKVARPLLAAARKSATQSPRQLWMAGKKPIQRADNDEENCSFVRGYN